MGDLNREQFNDLYGTLAMELQEVIHTKAGLVVTHQIAAAVVAALGSVSAILIAQSPDHRETMNLALDKMLDQLKADEGFQQQSQMAADGGAPDPAIEFDASTIAEAVNPKKGEGHGPHNCLYCALQQTIKRFHGVDISEREAVDDVMSAVAKVAANIISDTGVVGTIVFMTLLQGHLKRFEEGRSTEGMTKQ